MVSREVHQFPKGPTPHATFREPCVSYYHNHKGPPGTKPLWKGVSSLLHGNNVPQSHVIASNVFNQKTFFGFEEHCFHVVRNSKGLPQDLSISWFVCSACSSDILFNCLVVLAHLSVCSFFLFFLFIFPPSFYFSLPAFLFRFFVFSLFFRFFFLFSFLFFCF